MMEVLNEIEKKIEEIEQTLRNLEEARRAEINRLNLNKINALNIKPKVD